MSAPENLENTPAWVLNQLRQCQVHHCKTYYFEYTTYAICQGQL